MAISPARLAAMEVLQGVEGGAHADDLLHGDALRSLDARDAALTTAIVMTVLRRQRVLDAAIVPKLRSIERTPRAALLALRLGLAQLWFLDRIPAHAALSESVELTRAFGEPQSAPMVNAVLRRLSSRESRPVAPATAAQAPWMLARWQKNFGDDAALRIAEDSQREPTHTGRARPEHSSEGGAFLSRAIVTGSSDDPAAMLRMQDEGSQLVAEIAGAAAPGGMRVLDACSAPGGKTQVLAELLPQANILAIDASAPRLRSMAQLLAPEFAARIELARADATKLTATPPFENEFDLALCDVPCSGTGTLARNPEIRLRLKEGDLYKHAQRQQQILAHVWPLVRVGGTMVYSTCSLEPEENDDVVAAFLSANHDAEAISIARVLETMESAGALRPGAREMLTTTAMRGDFLQTQPGVHPCDGFFVAVLRKRGG